MVNFDFFEPTTVEEACSLLRQYGDEAKALAGGTDLLIFMRERKLNPRYVIHLKTVSGLSGIEYDEEKGLRIGALTTIREVETSPLLREKYPHLAAAATDFASIQIRNLATIGGNVCNASPAGDTLPALLTMDAQAKIVGPAGERTVPLEEFFTGPGRTVLQPGEIVTAFTAPPPAPHTGGVYYKLAARRALDIAFVGVAATVSLAHGNGKCGDVKIALGAVAPTPIRATAAEELLMGQALEDALLEQVGEAAMAAASPITDVRASAEYRRQMVRVLTKRMVKQAYELAQGGRKNA